MWVRGVRPLSRHIGEMQQEQHIGEMQQEQHIGEMDSERFITTMTERPKSIICIKIYIFSNATKSLF